jgi:outer membrane lipoprotein-sorting protein
MTAGLDAFELLRKVSDAYRAITTLQVEAVNTSESGNEDGSSRSEQRVRFFYSAPNRVRYDCVNGGILQVVDGAHLHTLFRRPRGFRGGPRVHSIPISEMHLLPHLFRPDSPLGSDGAFLFQTIEEGVDYARILRQEDGCHVVAVTYKQPSPHPAIVTRGDILFWVSTDTLMIMKQQGDLGHRAPMDDEVRWTRLTMSVREIRLNEPIPEETFRFMPPADANTGPTGQCGFSIGGGGGFTQKGPNERRRLEHRGSHEWQGDTLIEHSEWKIRGIMLTFERRFSFSDDELELNITERIIGPQGEAEGNFKLPLS